MAKTHHPYDCIKNPPEWVSWRIIDPKWPNHFIRIPRRPGEKTCDEMIRSIVDLRILKHGKFEEIETGGKSALVFSLNIPGSGKELVSKHKLKWGKRALSTRTITAIGAASVIGATAIGASAHYWMSNKQRYSFQQELSDAMTEYQKKYKKSTEQETLNSYATKLNRYWTKLDSAYTLVKTNISEDVDVDPDDKGDQQNIQNTRFLTQFSTTHNINLVAKVAVLLRRLDDNVKNLEKADATVHTYISEAFNSKFGFLYPNFAILLD